MGSHDRQVVVFLSLKLLFTHKTGKKRRSMTPLSRLSLILVTVCIFVPIMILSITRGFQHFSLDKLSSFYNSYFVYLDSPVSKSQFFGDTEPRDVFSYYQDYIFLKKGAKEFPSLMRAVPEAEIRSMIESKSLLLFRGEDIKDGEILLSESLAIGLGADIGTDLEAFLFLPQNSFPIRQTKLRVSGIVSFQNALLDRSISMVTPKTMEQSLFIGSDKINTFNSVDRKSLEPFFPSSKIFSLGQIPSVKQMQNQYVLLLLLALASSGLCFFSLFMNFKTNLKNQLYSIYIFKILGVPESLFIRVFFLQNIFLIVLGISLGILLSFLVVPHISFIVQGAQDFLNVIISFLKSYIFLFRDLSPVEFFPADIFYIRHVPVRMAFQDFLYLSVFLLGGMVLIQRWYAKILEKQPIVETLKKEQGI